MSSLWHTLIYQPLYNILIFLIAITPGVSVGVGIILLTILIKVALYPFTKKASLAQRAMREIQPELNAIKEKYGKDREQLARKTMDLYKEKGVSPFSGCLPMLVQLPIIFGLYFLIYRGLTIDPSQLYPFIPHPGSLDMHFLGSDLAGKSAIFALLAGITQYIQTKFMLPATLPAPVKEGTTPSLQEEFAKSMNVQMLYVFPIMIAFVSYSTSAAVALYFLTSNILGIAQEYMIRKHPVPATPKRTKPS